MCMYITSGHGVELSGRVCADMYNLINICTVLLCSLALVLHILCMIHKRHVILKAVLHTIYRLAV